MSIERVLLAEPRGFCAGVEMAIKALAWMVRAFEPPVYCFHEIVHNQVVVDRFREQGVVFVDDVGEVPEGAPLMLSAHGSAPEIAERARSGGRFVVNAVCPLVTKVHHEARVRARRGYTILYVGHAGHDEAVGTVAVAPDAIRLVESEADLDDALGTVADRDKVALLAQTTLALPEWQGLLDRSRERFPQLWTAERDDLCFATTNRQAALTEIARRADAVVVIGSANSSNTLALAKVAEAAGCRIVLRVDGPGELDLAALGDVGHRRCHRRRKRPRGAGRLGHREARAVVGRRGGACDRGGRVLPAAPGPARGDARPRHRGRSAPGRRPRSRPRRRRPLRRRPARSMRRAF